MLNTDYAIIFYFPKKGENIISKILFIYLLIFGFLNLEAKVKFSDLVVQTFLSKKEMSSVLYGIDTLEGFESNKTKKKIKEDFEKILPIYLEKNDSLIISKGTFSISQAYNRFLNTSGLYINYIGKKDKAAALELLKKNLSDLRYIMKNSKDFYAYGISVILYEGFLKRITIKEWMKTAFKKYPIPPTSIVFPLIAKEDIYVKEHIKYITSNGSTKLTEPEVGSYIKLFLKTYRQNRELYIFALRSNSKSKIETYYKKREIKINECLREISDMKSMLYENKEFLLKSPEDRKVKLYSMAKFNALMMPNICDSLSEPFMESSYFKHIELTRKYKDE